MLVLMRRAQTGFPFTSVYVAIIILQFSGRYCFRFDLNEKVNGGWWFVKICVRKTKCLCLIAASGEITRDSHAPDTASKEAVIDYFAASTTAGVSGEFSP